MDKNVIRIVLVFALAVGFLIGVQTDVDALGHTYCVGSCCEVAEPFKWELEDTN